jgi:hypothetical protein
MPTSNQQPTTPAVTDDDVTDALNATVSSIHPIDGVSSDYLTNLKSVLRLALHNDDLKKHYTRYKNMLAAACKPQHCKIGPALKAQVPVAA